MGRVLINMEQGENMKNYKYKIFDMDGTLLDSMFLWKDFGKNYLLHIGIRPPENLSEILSTMTLEKAAEYFIEAFGLKSTAEEILDDMKKLVEYKYKYELKLKPYVKEYLQKSKDEGALMCVATASSLNLAMAALERNDILKYFSFVSSCEEVGVGKHKPDIFYYAVEKLKATPSETVVYEDAYFAIKTAKEAGFYTIGVYDEVFEAEREKIEKISDKFIETFRELL